MEVGRKSLVLTLVFLFLIAGVAPSVSASLTGFQPFNIKQSDAEKNSHPDYYNITIYRCKGFGYEKIVKTIPYEVAMEIKQRFENIDTSLGSIVEKTRKKLMVLEEYNVFSKEDLKKREQYFNKQKTVNGFKKTMVNEGETNGTLFLVEVIVGTFGPDINIGINIFFYAPLFFCVAKGVNLEFHGLPPLTLVTDKIMMFGMVGFLGDLVIFPFISPGGLIDGFAIAGFVGEVF
ncbi:MAG: hypothetical protein J7L32_03355 [Thermoplasmata archaeon]|nr:hypothetical protein [Thermoplasmata archaeon]